MSQIISLVNEFESRLTVSTLTMITPLEIILPNITVCLLTKLNGTRVEASYPEINITMANFMMNSLFSAYNTSLMDPMFL